MMVAEVLPVYEVWEVDSKTRAPLRCVSDSPLVRRHATGLARELILAASRRPDATEWYELRRTERIAS